MVNRIENTGASQAPSTSVSPSKMEGISYKTLQKCLWNKWESQSGPLQRVRQIDKRNSDLILISGIALGILMMSIHQGISFFLERETAKICFFLFTIPFLILTYKHLKMIESCGISEKDKKNVNKDRKIWKYKLKYGKGEEVISPQEIPKLFKVMDIAKGAFAHLNFQQIKVLNSDQIKKIVTKRVLSPIQHLIWSLILRFKSDSIDERIECLSDPEKKGIIIRHPEILQMILPGMKHSLIEDDLLDAFKNCLQDVVSSIKDIKIPPDALEGAILFLCDGESIDWVLEKLDVVSV